MLKEFSNIFLSVFGTKQKYINIGSVPDTTGYPWRFWKSHLSSDQKPFFFFL